MSRPPWPMRVRMSRPELVGPLSEALAEGDCLSVRVDENTLLVVHRTAVDATEARVELEFFLRAWSRGDSVAELV